MKRLEKAWYAVYSIYVYYKVQTNSACGDADADGVSLFVWYLYLIPGASADALPLRAAGSSVLPYTLYFITGASADALPLGAAGGRLRRHSARAARRDAGVEYDIVSSIKYKL